MDFKKDNKTGNITTNDNFVKSAELCYNKRQIVIDPQGCKTYNTVPFGFTNT